ncbi:hypothetical protein H8F21_16910 [Pseudomonas sp. P66]|uniref:Uncharacterized protein n=1 Tax=Pseudomonas arcuscaelestis TaxID=2710591 RepID=A0ABS2C067_9PSED|nr:hypothetical protein [Pseudomonas arcuscaelestis]MBM5459249.1 hypothetical protein [Pseudomonas arcuscaelestis]
MEDEGKNTISELLHRRSAGFADEFVDKYTAMAISWNDEERLHLTFGRDSLEVISESIVPDPQNPDRAVLAHPRVTAHRNDVVALTIPLEVAEDLAITILKMVHHAQGRTSMDSKT